MFSFIAYFPSMRFIGKFYLILYSFRSKRKKKMQLSQNYLATYLLLPRLSRYVYASDSSQSKAFRPPKIDWHEFFFVRGTFVLLFGSLFLFVFFVKSKRKIWIIIFNSLFNRKRRRDWNEWNCGNMSRQWCLEWKMEHYSFHAWYESTKFFFFFFQNINLTCGRGLDC